MAKAKKSKSTKTGKLPKTVAGIELPKELRKQGAKLLELVKNPLVGDLLAAGLVALAANVRNQGKTAGDADSSKDKQSAADGFSRTAATLATVVAARAAEKITSKLTAKPAPVAPASAQKPASRKPAVAKPATVTPATVRVRQKPGPKPAAPAASTPAATAPKAATKPRTPAKPRATTRKPATRKPAPKS